jgi:EAL domain-containing protein (putative c-di-GMP-specific phosphodiesterase class I)
VLFEVLESPGEREQWQPVARTGAQSLNALGVSLVEDGLASGYRPPLHLKGSSFERIKVDQSIIMQIRHDPLGTLRNMRQLIRVGHDMGLEVVVEGLESPEMIEAASILGADFGQGFAVALARWRPCCVGSKRLQSCRASRISTAGMHRPAAWRVPIFVTEKVFPRHCEAVMRPCTKPPWTVRWIGSIVDREICSSPCSSSIYSTSLIVMRASPRRECETSSLTPRFLATTNSTGGAGTVG